MIGLRRQGTGSKAMPDDLPTGIELRDGMARIRRYYAWI
tara:strand:- start:308 stop:424 length:117 start_codon:yes stop_codon:yes gene_type:complete